MEMPLFLRSSPFHIGFQSVGFMQIDMLTESEMRDGFRPIKGAEVFPFSCVVVCGNHSVVFLEERHDAFHLRVVCNPGVYAATRR